MNFRVNINFFQKSLKFFSTIAEAKISLQNFKISEESVQLLKKFNIDGFFPIQAATYNSILKGRDIIGKAHTGTGKTLAFALPIIEKLTKNKEYGRKPRALIFCPTRELAKQVATEFRKFSSQLSIVSVYGGTAYGPSIGEISRGCDIVVGTPGRIKDLYKKGYLSFKDLQVLCLDEADHMLDIGFEKDIEEIIEKIRGDQNIEEGNSSNYQTLLFSATIPNWIKKISKKYLREDCDMIDIVGNNTNQTNHNISYEAIPCSSNNYISVIPDLIHEIGDGRCLIFSETQADVKSLQIKLSQTSMSSSNVGALYGSLGQNEREKTLDAFKKGSIRCIVATNVAARGLDIPNVDTVIQLGVPESIEPFIHRR
jgi:ATP-dependent RNA helicase DDX21